MALMTFNRTGQKPQGGVVGPGHEIIDRYSQPEPPQQQPPEDDINTLMSKWGGGGQPYGGAAPMAAAKTREVGANELVANQLTGLMSHGGNYLKSARAAGAEAAAARGSAAGNYYAGASEKAALDAALPIASQDAATYGRTASENMGAENAANLENAGNATSIINTNTNASNQRFGQILDYQNNRNRLAFDREDSAANRAQRESEYSRGLQENQKDRDFRSNEARTQRAYDAHQANVQLRRDAIAKVTQTVLSNPAYMRDPAGASGLIRFYTDQIDKLFPDLDSEFDIPEPAKPGP